MDFIANNSFTNTEGILPDGLDFAKLNMSNLLPNLPLLSLLMSLSGDRSFPKTTIEVKDEYDYVIVGGGTAGCVLANRLSEEECVSVLLLEAGGEAPLISEIPSAARILIGTSIDWFYKTTSQKYGAFGQKENKVIWSSGKGLGGGSILNAMLYLRGNKKNYDDWKREGCDGWGYKDVLPYFKKLEDNNNIQELDRGYHHTGGPMTAEKPKYTPEIKFPVLEATKAMGYEAVDVNGRRQTGIYDLQGTLRNGLRCSTAKAYLVPAEDRKNLDIVKYAFARKILIREPLSSSEYDVRKKPKAYGVEFDYLGQKRTVKARKEIIISSGSIRTPQILMLSGIGPRDHLREFGIPVIANLPVGQNLQDHFGTNAVYLVNATIMPVVLKNVDPVNILNFTTTRSGPLASPSQCTVLAFLNGLNTTKRSPDFPRQELYFAEYATLDAEIHDNLKPEVYNKLYGGHELQPMYTCAVSTLQPYGRGEILLNSTDPHVPPLMNPNYYKDQRDLRDVVEGLKICDAVANSPEMRQVQSRPLSKYFPGCEKYARNEDEYYACHARTLITTEWHIVGTARMGHFEDPRSVVDPKLRVIGIDGLRVVNAAIMPIVPSANINVPTMMVAEKAADMIKETIKCKSKEDN